MAQPLKKDDFQVRVTVQTVRDASRRVSKSIDSLTDRLSQETGDRANRAADQAEAAE